MRFVKVFIILILLIFVVGSMLLGYRLLKNVGQPNYKVAQLIDEESLLNLYSMYEIVEKNENSGVASIEFNSKLGIQYVKYDDVFLQCNGKTNIVIDYEVEDKQSYIFKVKEIDKEEQEFVLNVKIDSQISEYQDSKYFTIKSDGIKLARNISIDYQYVNDCKNYYTLDDGETWQEYNGEFQVKDYRTNIKLRTLTDQNIITKKENKDINIELEADALALQESNGIFTSYINDAVRYVMIDESAIGKKLNFTLSYTSLAWGMNINASFMDRDNNILGERYSTVRGQTFSVVIPNNATKFQFSCYQSYNISLYLEQD